MRACPPGALAHLQEIEIPAPEGGWPGTQQAVNVFNVFNQRKPTSWQSTSEDGPYSIDNEYSLPVGFTAPRSVQFTLSYDY